MPNEFYKVVHLTGVAMLFLSVSAMLVRASVAPRTTSLRKLIGCTHGAGLLLLLAAGFGVVAKDGLSYSGWVLLKMAIWVAFALMPMLIKRVPNALGLIWSVTILLGLLVAYLATHEPSKSKPAAAESSVLSPEIM